MPRDYLAEQALIDLSRLQREATDKEIRRILTLIDAGLSAAEAASIMADVMEAEQMEMAA